jgi:thiol-disulfide isomerase/thioredoxin
MKAILLLLLPMLVSLSGAGLASAATPSLALHDSPRVLPDIRFQEGDNRTRALADFKGKVVLLNVWATWCVPCRKEMPTLDRLQGALGGTGFEVVALSLDRGGREVVRKFYDSIGISRLGLYVDASSRTMRELSVGGLPTTLLIDAAGREIGRVVGPVEWDAPETVSFIRGQLAQQPTGNK